MSETKHVKCLMDHEDFGLTKDKIYLVDRVDSDGDVVVFDNSGYPNILFVGEFEIVEDKEDAQ